MISDHPAVQHGTNIIYLLTEFEGGSGLFKFSSLGYRKASHHELIVGT